MPGGRLVVSGASDGPLKGLTFAAKDLFDVEGHVTGCGSPDWAASHEPASKTAEAIRLLLDAGATLAGKTVTDEISLGLLGRNRHVGAPVNPRAPERYAGGSSSGSASAVAGGIVPFALGSDSGGSMRVPASFCGIYGLRPTHGAIPTAGLMVQSPSFDSAGFFAPEAEMMARVGDVLLPLAPIDVVDEVLIAEDAFALASDEIRDALRPGLAQVKRLVGSARSVTIAEEGLSTWNALHVHLQHPEFARTFAAWVDEVDPRLSFDVAKTIANAGRLPEAACREAKSMRPVLRERIDTLLDRRRIICLPTTPILPPMRNISLAETGAACDAIVDLTCIAGLTGLPQISLPLGDAGGLPVGLSLIGWRGSDRTLIDFAGRLAFA